MRKKRLRPVYGEHMDWTMFHCEMVLVPTGFIFP